MFFSPPNTRSQSAMERAGSATDVRSNLLDTTVEMQPEVPAIEKELSTDEARRQVVEEAQVPENSLGNSGTKRRKGRSTQKGQQKANEVDESNKNKNKLTLSDQRNLEDVERIASKRMVDKNARDILNLNDTVRSLMEKFDRFLLTVNSSNPNLPSEGGGPTDKLTRQGEVNNLERFNLTTRPSVVEGKGARKKILDTFENVELWNLESNPIDNTSRTETSGMKSRLERDLNIRTTEKEMWKSVGQKKIEFEMSGRKEKNFDDNVKSSVLNRYDEAREMSPNLRPPRQLENGENIEKEKL
ncbi:hypothetical protein PV326_001833, partial [Microctonus aethiopoides]